ncbi:MAG: glutamine amidotransferase-related protein [Minwuia sp.]|uniref:glutamine amidotransferase-related protein n=1 Tax=Minwuia sp. TaxID=2493630 RepID=UPI003A86D021
MQIGILETGLLPPGLKDIHGDFPSMFRNWLAPHLPEATFRTWTVIEDDWPAGVGDADAWLVTGSRFGVYDPEPWIESLKVFIREAAEAGVPQLGICFGHQIMAEAMGGKAVKSPKGWGAGIHDYRLQANGESVTWPMLVSHQDQVVEVPPGARAIGGSDHCPFGVIEYEMPLLTCQFHPEFDPALSAAILRERAGVTIPEAVASKALASLATSPRNREAGAWMATWLKTKLAG